MTDQTQIEVSIKQFIEDMQKLNGTALDEKSRELFLMVQPPKTEVQKVESNGPKFRDDNPERDKSTKKATSETRLNPAFVQKALDAHFETILNIFERSRNADLGAIAVRILLIFHQDEKLPQRLSELLLKVGPGPIRVWGPDFARNQAIYLGQYYKQSGDKNLRPLLIEGINALIAGEHITDAMDAILEANDISLVKLIINEENALKVSFYVQQCLFFAANPENYEAQMTVMFHLMFDLKLFYDALHIAINLNSQQLVNVVYQTIQTLTVEDRLQFCIVMSAHPELSRGMFEADPVLKNVLGNNHISNMFLKAVQKLQLSPPRSVDDIMRKQDIEIDWAKMNVFTGNFMLNGLVHMGYQDDLMFNSHLTREAVDINPSESQVQTAAAEAQRHSGPSQVLPEGHHLFLRPKLDAGKSDIETSVSAASLGLLHAWSGYTSGFEPINRIANSPDRWVRLGSLLAYGIAAHGTQSDAPFDFLANLLGGFFNPYFDKQFDGSPTTKDSLPHQYQNMNFNFHNAEVGEQVAKNTQTAEYSNIKEAFAALSMGIAYMGTGNTKIVEILSQRLRQSSCEQEPNVPLLEKYPRCIACFALGLVCAGSGDTRAADLIIRVMAGNSRSQRVLRFFPLCTIGVALIFLQQGKTQAGLKLVNDYQLTLLDQLNAVKKLDSPQEKLQVTAVEDNIQLAAYLQTAINIFAHAGLGDIQVASDLMTAMTDSILGRVAAEEAVEINKFDRAAPKKPAQNEMKDFIAETGQPLLLPSSERSIWPGDNMDPTTLLVVGLGFLAGDDNVLQQMIPRFAERILKFGNINAQRAVPLLIALTSLSNPRPELADDLAKLALHTDATISFNALLALGLIGAGTQNFKIAGVIRHVIESKCYSEEKVEHVIFGAQIAFGLLNAGKGAVGLAKSSKTQLAALISLLSFAAPSADVMMRPKLQILFYLFGAALVPKTKTAIDKNGVTVEAAVRAGRVVEDALGERPFRLAGFQLHQTPVVCGTEEMVVVVDEQWEAVWEGEKGVSRGVFVVRMKEKKDEKKEDDKKEGADIYK